VLLLQMYVASTLGVPMHKLVCKTKRIGGGFGGKETRRCVLLVANSFASCF
jgi:xanthine dehydrogenase/oxidase